MIFGASVDASPTQRNQDLNEGGWLQHQAGTTSPGFVNKCFEHRLEWLSSPQAPPLNLRSFFCAPPAHAKFMSNVFGDFPHLVEKTLQFLSASPF
jgi:hypothetical protein